MRPPQLARITLATHSLATALTGLIAVWQLGPAWSVAVVAPLLALLPGIYRCQLARLRLTAIILVPYLTVAMMETVANTELRTWAGLLMFTLLIELTLLIGLIRVVQHDIIGQNAADKGYG